jgi:acyloxyacyl hydrolase
MFLELIGNDVCKDSFDQMRQPEEFKANIITLLDYLDTAVPAGSHLVILGLGDGDILYEYLHD